jgi:hypothetical protein
MILFFIKIMFYVLVKSEVLMSGYGTGGDANYYHSYVIGVYNSPVNIWPVILRYLNDIGLYSRDLVTYSLFFLNLFIIPFITAKLSGLTLSSNQKNYLYIVLLCTAYPTLYFFTFDVYRDVFMVFSFLIGCIAVKKFVSSTNILLFIFYLGMSIAIGFFLLWLRPYLGYAFLASLLLWKVKFTKKRILFLGFIYALALFIANYAGLLNALTEYRSGFEEVGGGSTLGLNFSNPIMFIPNFILSTLGQMFGLYITNPLAVMLLVIETIPFFFMLVYVIKNIKLADNFVRFLIIFFILYASVWLIGNDNLGTAVRLRMYNYLAIYISFFYIFRLKKSSLKISKAVNL